MKTKYLFLFIFLLSSVSAFCQQEKNVEDEYAAYFTLPREALYVHLNKTTYFKGEEIWFKGYTYDQKNQLTSKATTNINVGIYDEAGNQLKKSLFKAENGVIQGNIAVDSTFSGGTYYIKAETNWMKNFKESNAFVQKIEIISEEVAKKNTTETEANYDFQFLPEGGHMVANTKNTIGFKLINESGKGVKASGIVYDSNKKEVASFEGNTFGLGKFLFQPKADQNYTAEIKLENGNVLNQAVPKAKNRGVAMIVSNPFPDKVIINFNTNAETLKSNPSKEYKVLIHQNGNLKTIAFAFENATEKIISIPKKELFKGINTITVFDDKNTPILERLFFNDFFTKKAKIHVSKLNMLNDSILFSISESQLKDNANISISVLPEMTKSYDPDHTIVSNFYLKSHIKSAVENPQYYFRDMNRKKKYELDILLLTQGWSRYNWDTIFGDKPNGLNRFENGIAISGTVNRPKPGVDRLFLYATKNHSARFIELDKDQKFTITNLFLEEGEEIRFSYMTEKGLFKKPSVYLRFSVSDEEDKISETTIKENSKVQSNSADFQLPENFFYDNSEQLDAVVIKAEKKKEKRDPILINGKVTEITEIETQRYINITDFIQYNGYNVSENLGRISITTRRTPKASPVIYFDNARLSSFNILYNLSTANVERIIIDKTGLGEGMNAGFGGVIKIYTRTTPLFKKGEAAEIFTGSTAPFAFTPAKEYYAPKYSSYLNNTFEKYGAISWIPELKLTKTKAVNFKVYNTKTKSITLFIEGITESGDLISEKRTIQIR
ncbi:hypothetical protein IMCC3317_23560 [Kordia antarctica]|uniref:TonB-dependent receptor plug domain-containing protein n=1 Tax=Kordia antarctica TaxID=1218801 RepID=A0A7L4ZK30_9FLAO|nr:hypothetical protein [Kordia antarctica]QHI36985.1 hypothetical protein IMCC3317_23560 [Kordia antarctica]